MILTDRGAIPMEDAEGRGFGAGVDDALSGRLHSTIQAIGLERARELAATPEDRRCVETAHLVLADDDLGIGFLHSGFALTALPHRKTAETLWRREAPGLVLSIESGREPNGESVGIPYGAVARMILLYLQTEAVRTRSREVELGRSLNHWLGEMGVSNGGEGYRIVREQSRRLSTCRLTFYQTAAGGDALRVDNGGFVRSAILPAPPGNAAAQLPLWRESVILDEGFYASLLAHPLPVREAAIRGISGRSMALDVYVWLAYRLHVLQAPRPISWPALYGQFGAGYRILRQFRANFREPLALALSAYPEARVNVSEEGITLHPSPPPVPERRIGRH